MADIWEPLRRLTQARIGLGRAGAALPTKALLEFQRAHAEAREAVWRPWDYEGLAQALCAEGEKVLLVRSQADNRAIFLQRPDLGRRLTPESSASLAAEGGSETPMALATAKKAEIAFVVSDGLSAKAIDTHFLPFWRVLRPQLKKFCIAPVVLAPFGRVALSDEIGASLRARLVVILLGERPGLSASDSLGAYLTYGPKLGNHDANRNCLSNIRPPEGLSYELAATRLMYLVQESLRLGISGVELKENAGELAAPSRADRLE